MTIADQASDGCSGGSRASALLVKQPTSDHATKSAAVARYREADEAKPGDQQGPPRPRLEILRQKAIGAKHACRRVTKAAATVSDSRALLRRRFGRRRQRPESALRSCSWPLSGDEQFEAKETRRVSKTSLRPLEEPPTMRTAIPFQMVTADRGTAAVRGPCTVAARRKRRRERCARRRRRRCGRGGIFRPDCARPLVAARR